MPGDCYREQFADMVRLAYHRGGPLRHRVKNWGNQFPGRIGNAVLVDGRWKVARSTLCRDLDLAPVTCPPR